MSQHYLYRSERFEMSKVAARKAAPEGKERAGVRFSPKVRNGDAAAPVMRYNISGDTLAAWLAEPDAEKRAALLPEPIVTASPVAPYAVIWSEAKTAAGIETFDAAESDAIADGTADAELVARWDASIAAARTFMTDLDAGTLVLPTGRKAEDKAGKATPESRRADAASALFGSALAGAALAPDAEPEPEPVAADAAPEHTPVAKRAR